MMAVFMQGYPLKRRAAVAQPIFLAASIGLKAAQVVNVGQSKS